MKINIQELDNFIKENYRNNRTWFSEEIGIDRSYITQILNGKKKAESPKAINSIIEFCNKNNIKEDRFIIF